MGSMGKEIGGNGPTSLADATVGGLLKAQSGGGDADKVEIGVVVDAAHDRSNRTCSTSIWCATRTSPSTR